MPPVLIRLRSKPTHEDNVIQDLYPGFSEKGFGGRVKEVLVFCTQQISFSND